jgi:hypothetical protein
MYEVNFLLKWKIWKMKLQVWAHVLTNWKANSSYRRSYQRKKNAIDEHKEAIKKYTKQETVRNREFNSLTKEVEFQELEIQLAEKQMKEMKASIEHKRRHFSIKRKIRSEIKSLET